MPPSGGTDHTVLQAPPPETHRDGDLGVPTLRGTQREMGPQGRSRRQLRPAGTLQGTAETLARSTSQASCERGATRRKHAARAQACTAIAARGERPAGDCARGDGASPQRPGSEINLLTGNARRPARTGALAVGVPRSASPGLAESPSVPRSAVSRGSGLQGSPQPPGAIPSPGAHQGPGVPTSNAGGAGPRTRPRTCP